MTQWRGDLAGAPQTSKPRRHPLPPPARASGTVRGGGSWGAATAAADARRASGEAGLSSPRPRVPEPPCRRALRAGALRRPPERHLPGESRPARGASWPHRLGRRTRRKRRCLPVGRKRFHPRRQRCSFNHIRACTGNAYSRLSPVPSILKGKKGSPPSPTLRSWSRRIRAHGIQPLADPVPRAVGEMDVVRCARRGRWRGRGRRARGRPRGGGLASRDQILEFQASTRIPAEMQTCCHPSICGSFCVRVCGRPPA